MAKNTAARIVSRQVSARGIRTHYLEGGEGPTLILLHSGEFGGCAEITWQFNLDALSRNFHVIAPDFLGYGRTEKLFSFEDMWAKRVRHIADFLLAIGVQNGHFIGNSMGGTMLLAVAAMPECPWPIDRMAVVSGGGKIPNNDAREFMNGYDCSLAYMRGMVQRLLVNKAYHSDEAYIERRYRASLIPGAWECTAAARFKSPGRVASEFRTEPDYSQIPFRTLIVAGAQDNLREPNYADAFVGQIPNAELFTMQNAGHFAQIDDPVTFNAKVQQFLST